MSQKAPQLSISPNQALYVLTRLIETGKITAREAEKLAARMNEEIAELEARLAALRGTFAARVSGRPAKRSGSASAHQSHSRRIQGEYMGLIRHVTGKDRARIKKVAAKQGREAAIRQMRALAR